MGFKQSPFPMMKGTKAHSSALMKTSAVKKTDYAAMQEKSAKKDPRYGKMTAEEYKKEVLRQVKHKKEHGTYDAMGTETKKRKADAQTKADADAQAKADAEKAAKDAAAAKETERKAVKTKGLGKKKGKTVFYASKNKGKIKGVDKTRK